MSFNLNSVLVISTTIFFLIFIILFQLWLVNRKDFRGLLNFVLAYLIVSLNSFLIIFRDGTPVPLRIIVQNTTAITYFLFCLSGISTVFKLKNKLYTDYALLAVIFLLMIIFSSVKPSFQIRSITLYAAVIYYNLRIIQSLVRIRMKQMLFWKVSVLSFSSTVITIFIIRLVVLLRSRPESFSMSINVAEAVMWALTFTSHAGIGLFFISAVSYLQKKKLSSLLNQRDILLKETHHRIKNNLTLLGSLVSSKSQDFKNCGDEFENLLDDIISRINTVTQIHDNLYQASDFATINLRDYIFDLIKSIRKANLDEKAGIDFNMHVEGIDVKSNLCLSIGLIVNELVTNSIKHAFKSVPEGMINILIKSENQKIYLNYSDNGCGTEEIEGELTENFGLQLVEALAEQTHSEFFRIDGSGYNCSVITPLT